jgi:hypothetical protein
MSSFGNELRPVLAKDGIRNKGEGIKDISPITEGEPKVEDQSNE